jgi:methylated-DNA-[protein]-cysteine S-methyltransferase
MERSAGTTASTQAIAAAAIFASPVGPLYARAEDGCITRLSFHRRDARGEQAAHLSSHGDDRDVRLLADLECQLQDYFAGHRTMFDVPLRTTPAPAFNRHVWDQLLRIPYGETISYIELARRVGDPSAARAVGTANGANPIAIVIPCHRVIGADGRLVGYGGGLARKQLLLDLESGRLRLPV